MKKLDALKVTKGVGMLLSIGGMLLSTYVSGKENEKVLAKLVEEKLGK